MKNRISIPTKTLPDGWKQKGADKFNVSTSMIEKVVWGVTINDEIFEYMLKMAEIEKFRVEELAKDKAERIAALTQ